LSPTEKKIEIPIRLETIAFIMLVSFSLILRLHQLSADPPIGLSASHGVFTDPSQYVSFARNLSLWGTFNPLEDYRLIFFLKSAMTLMSLIIFKIAGVGFWQANLAGLVFSFATIILMYFGLRKAAGSLAALVFLIFISCDYNQIFFGRLPFLENSMNFFAVLAFVILVYARRVYAYVIAGVMLAAGIFFGKLIGMIYLFPFACYAAWDICYEHRAQWKRTLFRYGLMAVGFLAIMIFWYFFSYRPATASVSGYVQEQALGLYGTPEAFQYADMFIYKFLSFGAKSHLFTRMPVPALLAWGMLLIFFFRAGFKDSWKNKFFGLTPGIIFLIAFVIAAYGALMIWNYRPLRYQTMLIYPVCALAGVFISGLVHNMQTGLNRKGYILFPIIFFVLAIIPIYKLTGPIYNLMGSPFHYTDVRGIVIAFTIVFTIGITLLMRYASHLISAPPRWFRNFIILAAVILTVAPGAWKYLQWSSIATRHIVKNAADLTTLISAEAVVSGPYAPVMTLENRFRNLIHMFGVTSADPDFFKKYPVTHLLLDRSNLDIAEKSYPEMMKNKVSLSKYRIGGRDVSLYRIAGHSGNPTAARYVKSAYEEAMDAYIVSDMQRGLGFMEIYERQYPENLTGNLVIAQIAADNGLNDAAETHFRRAIEFSPTDFYLHFKLGEFYINMYKQTGDLKFRKMGEEEFKIARKYNPEARRLARDIEKLLK